MSTEVSNFFGVGINGLAVITLNKVDFGRVYTFARGKVSAFGAHTRGFLHGVSQDSLFILN
jgi:hypothetical protein